MFTKNRHKLNIDVLIYLTAPSKELLSLCIVACRGKVSLRHTITYISEYLSRQNSLIDGRQKVLFVSHIMTFELSVFFRWALRPVYGAYNLLIEVDKDSNLLPEKEVQCNQLLQSLHGECLECNWAMERTSPSQICTGNNALNATKQSLTTSRCRAHVN